MNLDVNLGGIIILIVVYCLSILTHAVCYYISKYYPRKTQRKNDNELCEFEQNPSTCIRRNDTCFKCNIKTPVNEMLPRVHSNGKIYSTWKVIINGDGRLEAWTYEGKQTHWIDGIDCNIKL